MKVTENGQKNLQSCQTYFLALEKHDKGVLESLLADEVVEVIPFSNTGDQAPYSEFQGKQAVMGYLGTIVDNFSRTVLLDRQHTLSDDGRVVFTEAKGDLVQEKTGTPYRNLYIFKHVFDQGKIVHISEYANPVTFAKLMGDPLG